MVWLRQSVSQYNRVYCDREVAGLGGRVYRNTVHCIVNRKGIWAGLYCNTAPASATRRWAKALGARLGAQGAQAGARARGTRSRRAGAVRTRVEHAGRRGRTRTRAERACGHCRRATDALQTRVAGALARQQAHRLAERTRHRRWARGLGAWAGQGCALGALGLFLARFDSVLFLSQIF